MNSFVRLQKVIRSHCILFLLTKIINLEGFSGHAMRTSLKTGQTGKKDVFNCIQIYYAEIFIACHHKFHEYFSRRIKDTADHLNKSN